MKLRKKIKKAETNTLPLMDCMFILLIYFIFSMLTMTIHAGISLKLPEANQEETLSNKVQALHITNTGDIQFNKKPIDLITLRNELWSLTITTDVEVYITTEKKSKYGDLIVILDLLRELDITKVSIETDFKE